MADFNSATMVDVTDSTTWPTASFEGSIGTLGVPAYLAVTKYLSGRVCPQMLISPSGYSKKFLVTAKTTAQAGEIERWEGYTVFAEVIGSITGGTLTVEQVLFGDLSDAGWAALGSFRYVTTYNYRAGAWGLVRVSVDAQTGLGTYTITLPTEMSMTSQRFIMYHISNSYQAVSAGTSMVGSVSSAGFTGIVKDSQADQTVNLRRINAAASAIGKGLYFPAGTYRGVGDGGSRIYGASADTTILDANGCVNEEWTAAQAASPQLNPISMEDVQVRGFHVNNVSKNLVGCHIYHPTIHASFSGYIATANGLTTMTVTAVTYGSINPGVTVLGTGVTADTKVVKQISGAVGSVGVYQVSPSQTVGAAGSEASLGTWINWSGFYFSSTAPYAKVIGNTFDIPPCFTAVQVLNPVDVEIRGNKFPFRRDPGRFNFPFWVKSDDGLAWRIEIVDNVLDVPTIEGVFVGSNRLAPIRNLIIERNIISKHTEEAIGIDGLGNSPGAAPIICNGHLTTVANNAVGKVVVTMNQMVYSPSGSPVLSPVSTRVWVANGYIVGDVLTMTAPHLGYQMPGSSISGAGILLGTKVTGVISRTGGIGAAGNQYRLNYNHPLGAGSSGSPISITYSDWNKFYFIFSEETGIDGTICEIVDFNAANNTLTLDLNRSANNITTGSTTWAGVHAGFFYGSVKNNRVLADSMRGQNSGGTEFYGTLSGSTLSIWWKWLGPSAIGVGDKVVGVDINPDGSITPNNLLTNCRISAVVKEDATYTVTGGATVGPRPTALAVFPTFTGSISGTTLTITAVAAHAMTNPDRKQIRIGGVIWGTGVVAGTRINRQISGAANGVGTYEVTISQTVASTDDMICNAANYSTGISIYQNVFGFEVSKNEIMASHQGIRAVGGLILSTYHSLAYHNTIRDNLVVLPTTNPSRTYPEAIAVRGDIKQHGNHVYNNTVIDGHIYLQNSGNSMCENNILEGECTVIRTATTPTYPTIPS